MHMPLLPLGLAALMLATLTGCPKTGDYYGGGEARPAPEAPAQQGATNGSERWTLAWGTGLTGDERRFADAYTRATWVHAQLAAGQWDQAAGDLNVVLDELKAVQKSAEVPKEVRDRVAALLPVVRTLGRLVVIEDAASLRLASGLVAQLQNTANHPAVIGWVRTESGGGGGAAAGAPEAARALSLAVSPALAPEARAYTEAYARSTWVHMQLAAGDFAQAGRDLGFVREQLAALSRGGDVPQDVRVRAEVLLHHADELNRAIAERDSAATTAALRLVNAFNATTNDPVVLAWLK